MKPYLLVVCFVACGFLLPTGRCTQSFASDTTHVRDESLFYTRSILLGAHRGGKHQWPENTVVALSEAAGRWPEVLLEVDVHMTADGHVVVIHDERVDRTTNGTGFVNRMTLDEIQALDAAFHFTSDGGASYPYRGQGVTVPTLQEALESAPDHLFLIEMKDGRDVARATAAAIRAAHAEDQCIVASTRPAFIEALNKIAPQIATCYDLISGLEMVNTLREGDWDAYKPGHTMLTLSNDLKERLHLTPDEITQIRDKGILVLFFTINNKEKMRRLLDIGVDSILTDAPDILAALTEDE